MFQGIQKPMKHLLRVLLTLVSPVRPSESPVNCHDIHVPLAEGLTLVCASFSFGEGWYLFKTFRVKQ